MSAVAAPPAPALPLSTTPPPAGAPVVVSPGPYYLAMSTVRRFTLAEYHKMIESGVLIDGEPYELLEGYIVRKMSRGIPHDTTLQALHKRLARLLPAGWDVRQQSAITLTNDSEPEPDFALVRGDEKSYKTHHPGPTEIGLIVEVSASSLKIDQHDKGRIYARDAIPTYWVVNVEDNRIEVYSQPTAAGYQNRADYAPGASIPVELDGVTVGSIAVSDVIG